MANERRVGARGEALLWCACFDRPASLNGLGPAIYPSITSASKVMREADVLVVAQSFVFVACELFFLLMVFTPFLLTVDESGTALFKPFGPVWALFGLTCGAFLAAAVLAPI